MIKKVDTIINKVEKLNNMNFKSNQKIQCQNGSKNVKNIYQAAINMHRKIHINKI